ncbi:hypothetical protein [Methylorubrum sp. SB2]|uniref:hypothetical protein n=1 Tax=Methylorubrum subtropicum TaxID=3138812 RepID=UPI00313D840A
MPLDPESLDPEPRPTRPLLSWTVKVTLAVGLAAIVLGHTMSRTIDGNAARVAALDLDPVVTGSIGPSARATTLDPCVLRGR